MFRSLLRATTDAVRKAFAWHVDDMIPPQELTLFKFTSKADLAKWTVYSDSEHGGLSTASLGFCGEGSSTALFTGNLSVDLKDEETRRIVHSGFSGMRTRQGLKILDLDPFDMVAFRVKGDGRCYISTLRTESSITGQSEGNTWQAFIFAPKDKWHEVKIPFSRYVPTWRGHILEAKLEMNIARICGMTIAVCATGGPNEASTGPGDFHLELDYIKALRHLDVKERIVSPVC